MDVQRFVRGQTDYNLIVLANSQNWRLRGGLCVMNCEFENTIFRKNLSDYGYKQYGGQERAPGVCKSHSRPHK